MGKVGCGKGYFGPSWMRHPAPTCLVLPPQLLSIPPADIAQRLLAFKQLLPWTDVVHMVEIHPQLLGVEAGFVLTVVRRRIQLLKEGMRGADLATMVQVGGNPFLDLPACGCSFICGGCWTLGVMSIIVSLLLLCVFFCLRACGCCFCACKRLSVCLFT